MKLKDIARTATFAWDQTSSSAPLLVTGAVAGALDESFSNESQLEIWAPSFNEGEGIKLGGDGKGPEGSITVSSRFNRLAWSAPTANHAKGVIAAGMETGEVHVYDPEKIMAGKSADESRIFTSHKHTGPVRGLDFNPTQKNLLASGAVNAEIYIYDLNNPTKEPVTPGPVSNKLGEITSLQWNPTIARILAVSSSSGYTSVWDLRAWKEIVSLKYDGGAAKGRDAVAGGAGLQVGKRRGMSDVCWHPEQSTRLITSSDDDESPIIMLWDLRNTRAPETILSGHSKGVLSVSWCRQDADLLLSCGKDNRTLVWNPQTAQIVGELPATNDWAFQTTWCARNPDLLATASFDGHIGIHSLQTTQIPEQTGPAISETATADDVFGALGSQEPTDDNSNVLSLSQPPKWLRRPVSATFGYGGVLASISNLADASGKMQSGVHLRSIVSEQSILDRAEALNEAGGDKEKLSELCSSKVQEDAAWKTLFTLFKADSRDELIHMLGFSKEDVVNQVQEAIKQFPADRVSTVTFAEPESEAKADDDVETRKDESKPEGTPSEVSLTSDTTKRTETTEVTEQSLFDNEETPAAGGADADFFSSMTSGSLRNPLLDGIVPRGEVAASSVAATVGSRASSVRSETIKDNNFRIYPSGESDVDRLVTQALVLGDFKSAVDLCLASERFADALLLAVRGGPDLLASTQKAYFARRTTSLPFLRVFQSIVTEDLADIVQNADLAEWKVVFVVLCTFAKDVDFNNLAEQLGQRLQFRSQVLSNSDSPEAQTSAKTARGDATLCYLAARRLEKVVSIWIDELQEEESASSGLTRYSAHAHALQSFIEKVAVFTAATGYRDDDLAHPTESQVAAETGARSYRLAGLYDRFYEYADLLATQGKVDMAAKYVQMTPSDYKGTGAGGFELDKARDRLFRAAGIAEGSAQTNAAFAKASPVASSSTSAEASRSAPAAQPTPYGAPSAYQPFGYAPAPTQQPAASIPASATGNGNNPYAPANYGGYSDQSPYAPAQPQQQQQQQPYQPSYNQSNGYPGDPQPQGYGLPGGGGGYAPNQQAHGQHQGQSQYGAPPAQTPLGPPPRANQATSTPPPVPAAQRRDMPGWNDAPNFAAPPKRPQSAAAKDNKPAPIMSPFPMSTDPMAQAGSQYPAGGQSMPPQGPPRAPSRGVGTPGVLPPPPKAGPRPPSAQQVARQAMPAPPQQQQQQQQQARPTPPPQARPPPRGGPPPGTFAGPPPPAQGGMLGGPPPRALSPLGPGRAAQQPPTIGGQLRPTAPPAEGGPRPDGLAATQNSQPRMGGPPPPGRGGPPPIPPTRSTPSPKPSTPAPVKQAHPAGDRSHIPASSKPIFDVLSSELSRVKQMNHPPAVKKIVDDTERRLNILFDGLNNESVPKQAIDKMHEIARAINGKDANAALGLHVQLLTNSVGDMTTWAPGVKQLIRLGL